MLFTYACFSPNEAPILPTSAMQKPVVMDFGTVYDSLDVGPPILPDRLPESHENYGEPLNTSEIPLEEAGLEDTFVDSSSEDEPGLVATVEVERSEQNKPDEEPVSEPAQAAQASEEPELVHVEEFDFDGKEEAVRNRVQKMDDVEFERKVREIQKHPQFPFFVLEAKSKLEDYEDMVVYFEVFLDYYNLPPVGEVHEAPQVAARPNGHLPDLPDGELPDGPGGGDLPDGELPDGPGGGDLPDGELPDAPGGGDLPDGEHLRPKRDLAVPGGEDEHEEPKVNALSVADFVPLRASEQRSLRTQKREDNQKKKQPKAKAAADSSSKKKKNPEERPPQEENDEPSAKRRKCPQLIDKGQQEAYKK